ncbi:hypothetical protein [Clostridium sp. ZBS18]|uniref:hypothetical protein n=1 Tax=Clostridium sp. ZBS18 TaxID=2949967 RepID=UPI002079E371|nr:hypothetical protein [Clostridium sp. ZBS18]
MIKFIGFDIWEGVTIEDNEKKFTCRTLEIKSTDYSALRIFEHRKNFYMLISKMVYCCELEFEIKEISKSLYLQLENLATLLKDTKSNIYAIEYNSVEAIEDNDKIKIKVCDNLKEEAYKELAIYKNSIENILKESRLVIN